MKLHILSRLRRRRWRPIDWEIKITSPDGELVNVDTESLFYIWKYGGHSTDGYLDILQLPRLHVWVKPASWQEPADRLAALDGTGAILPGQP